MLGTELIELCIGDGGGQIDGSTRIYYGKNNGCADRNGQGMVGTHELPRNFFHINPVQFPKKNVGTEKNSLVLNRPLV